MKLMTSKIRKRFKKQGDTSEKSADEIKIIVKYFNPTGVGTWFCFEYDGKDTLQCFANLGDDTFAETGTVSLKELKSFKGAFGLGVERDLYFGKHTLKEVQDFKIR